MASLIDNLKKYCEWELYHKSIIFGRVSGWKTKQKLSHRYLLLLTCPVYINTSAASSFSFFYLPFFIQIWLCFYKTKVTKKKLYGELHSVLKYNFRELEWIFSVDKNCHMEPADWNSLHIGSYRQRWKQFQRGLVR